MPRRRNRGKKYKSPMSNQNKPTRPEQASRTVKVQQAHIKQEIFQSDYPPPEMLQKYAQIDPSFPDRLLKMAEIEGAHRRKMERRVTGWSVFLDLLGTVLAPAVVVAILYVGYLFMQKNHANEGAWVIGTVTVALAVAFLTRGKRGKPSK
jgi:uncharacterized membrane protein